MLNHRHSFSDYPFPDNTPDYPHWEDMARYVNDYVDHFDVRRMIRFNTRVDRVVQDADRNGWTVETVDASDSRATLHVRAIAVATGHHAKPVLASFPGEKVPQRPPAPPHTSPQCLHTCHSAHTRRHIPYRPPTVANRERVLAQTFTGEMYHSIEYKDCHTNHLEGKRVLVVGIGNSAGQLSSSHSTWRPGRHQRVRTCTTGGCMGCHGWIVDVAMNATTVAKRTTISTRSGAWYAPARPLHSALGKKNSADDGRGGDSTRTGYFKTTSWVCRRTTT